MDMVRLEKGLMDAEDPGLSERLVTSHFGRDELAVEVAGLNRRFGMANPVITPWNIESLA